VALTSPRRRGGGAAVAGRSGRRGAYGEGVDWEFRRLVLPRGLSRRAAQRLLTDAAEYGDWELDRLRLFPDGRRAVVLRRKILRVRSTLRA